MGNLLGNVWKEFSSLIKKGVWGGDRSISTLFPSFLESVVEDMILEAETAIMWFQGKKHKDEITKAKDGLAGQNKPGSLMTQ